MCLAKQAAENETSAGQAAASVSDMGEQQREEVDSEGRPSLEADLGPDGGRGWCGGESQVVGCWVCLSVARGQTMDVTVCEE